jgi:hypothetical protein
MENNFDIHNWQARFLKESTETRTVTELGDFQGTLGELQSIVSNLIQEYGESAMLTADAGHNNVEFIITV